MNFIHKGLPKSDIELFFGQDEECAEFDTNNLLDIVTRVTNISRKGARAAGWDRPIPAGFSSFKIGKKFFWVLNTWEGAV